MRSPIQLSVTTLFAILALSVACAQPRSATVAADIARPARARLTRSEVIRLAERAAVRHGEKLRDYQAPEAHFEYVRRDRSWFVSFEGRGAGPGDHISVHVDDRTGETQFFAGR